MKNLPFFLIVLLLTGSLSAQTPLQTLIEEANALEKEYRKQIGALAEQAEDAESVRQQILPKKEGTLFIAAYPKEATPKDDSPFWKLRTKYAENLLDIAKKAANQYPTFAVNISISALRADPELEKVRAMLGQRLYEGKWRTEWEIAKLKSNWVDHPKFGWVHISQVPFLESGERPLGGRWVSQEEDARLHDDVINGWNIETEHYVVRTNHSIEEGVRVSRALEDYFHAWHLLFFRYVHNDVQLRAVLNGKGSLVRPMTRKNGVVLFRNKANFALTLGNILPGIQASLVHIGTGFYSSENQICYFFAADPNSNDEDEALNARRTLFHEATHQLFDRLKNPRALPSNRNAWIYEAIPLYMETFRREGDYYLFGDYNDVRMQAARYRAFIKKEHIPFGFLVQMSQEEFFNQKGLASIYSQCAGIGHFFMHAENGRFREPFVVLLHNVYNGLDTQESVFRLTEQNGAELDAAYREHLKAR